MIDIRKPSSIFEEDQQKAAKQAAVPEIRQVTAQEEPAAQPAPVETSASNQLWKSIRESGMTGKVTDIVEALQQQGKLSQAERVYVAEEKRRKAKAKAAKAGETAQADPYAALRSAADFGEKSKYASTARTEKGNDVLTLLTNLGIGAENALVGGGTKPFVPYGDKTVYADPMYEYINGNRDAVQKVELERLQQLGGLYSLGSIEHLKHMTADEVKIYNYLYATEGKEKANSYVSGLEDQLQQRWRTATEERAAAMAAEDPVGSSVLSTLMAPGKGVAYLGQAMDMIKDGTVNENAAYNYGSITQKGIREAVSKTITGSGSWGPVGSFAYQVGMSMADFLFTTAITGGQQGPALAIMGTGAAADTVLEAKQRGVGDKEAFALGTIAGIAEALMEKVGMDALFDKALLNKNTWGYVVKNVLSEGLEELGTDAINLLADILIAKDQSQWQQSIDAYKENGKTDTQAFWMAVRDQALSMGLSFLGGGISGGVMAGGGVAVNSLFGGGTGSGDVKTEVSAPVTESEGETPADAAVEADETVEPMEDLLDRMTPLDTALRKFRETGTVSGRVADIVAGNRQAVAALEEATGVKIGGTKAEQRSAVRAAVAALAEQRAAETARQEAEAAAYAQTDEGRNKAAVDDTLRQAAGLEPVGKRGNTVAANTNAVSKPIDSYPAEKQSMIRSYLQAMDEGIRSFVQRVKGGDLTFRRQKISDVSPKAARDIGALLGIDVTGYTHNINTNGVKHILNRHGANGEQDSTMASDEDIARIGWVLENYDSVEILTEGAEQVYSEEFRNQENRPAPQIRFIKKIDGSYYVVEAACENRYRKLWVQSAYLQKNNGDVTEVPADSPSAVHEDYAQSGLPSPSPDTSITHGGGNVNGNSAGEETVSVGAAPGGFTSKQSYYDQLTDENAQPDRPGDVRPMEVLKQDQYGRRVSETAANAYGAEITPDEMADQIQELIHEGALGFDTRTNEQSLKEAAEAIRAKGPATTQTQITTNMANGKIKDGDVEKTMLLYAAYANKPDQASQDRAAELMVDLCTLANMTGRNLQLFKLLRRMTPQGQYMSIQKTINRYVESLNSGRGKKHTAKVEIPTELAEDYMEAARADLEHGTAETEKAKAEVEQAIYKVAAAQIKASPMEKLNAWRYMAMLGNIKTQGRNIVGNAAFRPMVNGKRVVGAMLESLFVEQENRTKAVLGFGKEAQALRAWAQADSKNADIQKLFDYSARGGDEAKTAMDEERAIYDTKWLEETRKFVQKVPEEADMRFKRWEYSVSLASFLKARGYTAGQITAGEVSEGVLDEARQYAAKEALKATFNDQNAVSDFVSRRYKGDNAFAKAINTLAEGVLPFRRTPANIAVRAVEYSPANVVRSVYNLATKVRGGEMAASTALDQMASGLTGTAAMALGFALAQGIFGIRLVGKLDEEDEKNAGRQGYALEIGGTSYTVDWAAPANIPLFIGANIHSALQDKQTDTSALVSVLDACKDTVEPMLELSCLSSLNDLLQTMSYAEEGTYLYSALASAASSYLNQYIPTLFGQMERATEGEKKQTYSDGGTALERSIQKTIGYATQKIPGVDLFQTQKLDHWGNPVEGSNWFDALVNPGTVSQITDDPVDQEIRRLNDAQTEQNVTVKKPGQSITYTDKAGNHHENQRLTGEQWETMQRVYGQTAHGILAELIKSDGYGALSEEQKAAAFSLAYDYARETARMAAIDGYPGHSDKWMEGIQGGEADAIIRKVAASAFSDAFGTLTKAWEYGKDTTGAVEALTGAYNLYGKLSDGQKEALLGQISGRGEDLIRAMDAGVSADTFAGLYEIYKGITDNKDLTTSQRTSRWAYELQKAVDNGTITEVQRGVLVENMTISTGFSQTADESKIDEYVEAGIDTDKAMTVAEALAGIQIEPGHSQVRTVQKAEAIAGMEGLSQSEKANVMKIYLSDSQDAALDRMMQAGYSPEVYARLYRVDMDTPGGKDAFIQAMMANFSITKAEAKRLYSIYNGK